MNKKTNSLTAFKKPTERILPSESATASLVSSGAGDRQVQKGPQTTKEPKPASPDPAEPTSVMSFRMKTTFVDELDEIFSQEKIKRRKAGDRGFKKISMAEEAFRLWLEKHGYER